MKTLITTLLILLISTTSFSQQPKKLKVDILDIAWTGTIVGDRLSTNRALSNCPSCYEQSPIKNSNIRMATQFSLLGVTKFLEYKYPDHPKTFRLFKSVMVGFGTFVIIHNLRK